MGPMEFYRRFMAGFNVTMRDYLQDHSDWAVCQMSPWHNELFAKIPDQ